MSLTSRAYASETPGVLMMQHYQRLAVAARILLWTTGFSLILSVTMVVFMYMRRKRLSEVCILAFLNRHTTVHRANKYLTGKSLAAARTHSVSAGEFAARARQHGVLRLQPLRRQASRDARPERHWARAQPPALRRRRPGQDASVRPGHVDIARRVAPRPVAAVELPHFYSICCPAAVGLDGLSG
ncbi:hypothetical protein BJ166DRAFT_542513 [Pestalotiopsis sp. NC0098]|nr:hypothetical protein BJ166DRAFT_542513 [Pestalotiopsis sp. NC0098]